MPKKVLAIVLIVLTAFAAVSCGKSAEKLEPYEAVKSCMGKYGLSGGDLYSPSGREGTYVLTEDLIASYYGRSYADHADFTGVSDYCVWMDTDDPMHPREIGVFAVGDSSAADSIREYIRVRIDSVTENAKGYPSLDVRCYENAVIG